MNNTREEFAGFPQPTKNFFSLPNEIINIIAHITNLAELKVIIYVIRHTWGFQEYGIKKAITTDEFMHGRKRNDGTRMDEGTGLSNRSVIDGLRAAVEHGYLEDDLDETDKARKVKSYALKMQAPQVDEMDMKKLHMEHDNGYEESSHQREEASYQGEESSHQREEASYRTEKDTKERHLEKDTKERQSVSPSSEMTTSMRTLTSSEINNSDELASHLPQCNDEKPIPPNPDKSQTNKPTLTSQELADRRYWATYVDKEKNITKADVLKGLNLHYQWLSAYGAYGDSAWDIKALIWIAQHDNGTWENIQKVYRLWEDKEPSKPIHPEMIKNKWFWLSEKKSTSTKDKPATTATSSISHVSQEISDRNLARLHARIAAKRAAAGKEG